MEFPEHDGLVWSATAFDLDDGEVLFAHETGRVLKTASIGKVFLLHTVLEEELAGRLSLDEPVTRRPSDWMDDSGLWYLMQASTLSIYDLCALIGAVSDNHATNTLVRRVGIEAVQASTEALGYRDSALHDMIRWPRPPGAPQTLSSGTAAELSDFVARLARKELLTPEACDMFRRWLGAGMDCSMVPSGFGLDPLAHDFFDRGLWVWNKTGTMSTVRADIGVVMSPERRVAYAVLANWAPGEDRRDEALAVMREAGLAIREHVLA
ncbi:serine hydrolase [Agromyces archimandritae]|uniref:Serine hydrolase n=1 Tax=Agromyces archimandritae TaxID=2781962 RepID=A0A975IRB6_9MICO|nr:serine hydrolase [Agromyces archimandritae]QTX05916.1 serine hydrolase [Agromyces archimandritae]